MSDKCGKCNSGFASGDVSVQCTECKALFHPPCTRLGTAQTLTKTKLKTWKCDTCKGETASTASVRSGDDGEDKRSILEALYLIKNDLSNQISAVQGSISTLSAELKDLGRRVVAIEGEQSKTKLRCDQLESRATEMTDDVRTLQARLLDVEQHSRAANIEIQGLPITTGEDVYCVLSRIASAMGVGYSREDISIAHRLRLYSRKHVHPPLIVQFVSRSVKDAWSQAARVKRGINTSSIDPSLRASTVYINDHLTSDNKALLGRARRLYKQKKLHFATYSNGKVLIKRREGDDILRVTHLDQLDEFDK